jgi:uncharacterized membrane protein
VNKRLSLLFRHAAYSLRGGFLVRPLGIALALGFAGALLSWLEEVEPAISGWAPAALFPSHAEPQVAQIILGAIAASIMTVVSIVFAILLMTLTLASMQFSPRIIVSFTRDRVTQWTLGMFLGTFLYCVAALPAARNLPRPFAPVTTVLGAMLLAIACVGWLLFFIQHISQAISVNHIVDRIASETEAVIAGMMPWPYRPGQAPAAGLSLDGASSAVVASAVSGYIRFIDTRRLLFMAKTLRVKVQVLRRVGQFVPQGIPLLAASKADRLSDYDIAAFRGAFDLGPSRTLQQDVEFGVLQIVDIALKAISPAVNDPTTAISCVDQLSRILILFGSREQPEPVLYDPPGAARVGIPWIGFEGLLDSAFEQIRMYAKNDVAVSLRLLRAYGDIAYGADPLRGRMLFERGRRVLAGCAEQLSEDELRRLRERLAALEEPFSG